MSRQGPIEASPWPEVLTAHVVDPGPPVRIHGYAVETDLALHLGFVESAFLSLTGELPGTRARACFEVALHFLSPAQVAEAPAHAGVVARLAGGNTTATLGAGLLALLEQARVEVDQAAPGFAAWEQGAPPPSALCGEEPEDGERLRNLTAALAARGIEVPRLAPPLSGRAAVLLLLAEAGLVLAEQQVAAYAWARLPALAAEILAVRPGAFQSYPMRLPDFQYRDKEQP